MKWMRNVTLFVAGIAVGAVLTQSTADYATWVAVATPLALLLLVFAARNHWTSERKPKTLAVQVAGLAGWLLFTDVLATVL